MTARRSAADVLIDTSLFAFTALAFGFIALPIVVLIVFSFNVDRYPSIPWAGTSLKWYRALLADPGILDAARNTAMVGASVAVLSTLLGTTAAYFSNRWVFRGKVVYAILTAAPPTVPLLILGLSLLVFLNQINLSGGLAGVVLGQTVLCSPFAMGLTMLRLSQMDNRLEEVSWNLGAGEFTTFRHVVLPQLLPALLVALMLTFALSLDEFIIAWFVSGLEQTLPVKIYTMLGGSVNPQINAIGTIVFCTSQILVACAATVWWRSGKVRR